MKGPWMETEPGAALNHVTTPQSTAIRLQAEGNDAMGTRQTQNMALT